MNLSIIRLAFACGLFGLCSVLCCGLAMAQDEEQEVEPQFTMEIGEVRTLSISDASIDFSPSPEDVLAGWSDPESTIITVSANDDWALKISASTAKWNPIGRNKPNTDLKWWVGSNPEAGLSTTPATVDQDSSGAMNEQITVNFRVRLINSNTNQFDRPDMYSLTVVFDIGAQS
jgi:hypothetical protein